MAATVDQLAKEFLQALNEYTEEVQEAVAEAVQDVGKMTARDLRGTTQVTGSNIWRNYPKGWTNTVTKKRGRIVSEVHNKTGYRLTHLLENGHVIKNGTGRTFGRTREFVHIAPAETKAVTELEKKIKEAIEG